MAILSKEKMSGSEFKDAINNALDKEDTGEQIVKGSLKIEKNLQITGDLSLNGALIDSNSNGFNIKSTENEKEFLVTILNDKITFTNDEDKIINEIGHVSINKGFEIKTNEDIKIGEKTSNVVTIAWLSQGNLIVNMSGKNTGVLGEKSIGFGNTNDSNILNGNALVLTSRTGIGDDQTYSSLYLYPPKKSSWSSTNTKEINSLDKSLKLVRRGIGSDTGDINNDANNYYIYGDHNPYFHPIATRRSTSPHPTCGIWIDYDTDTIGYINNYKVRGHQGILTYTHDETENSICLCSINVDQSSYDVNFNSRSTFRVLSPKNALNEEVPLEKRLKFQSESNKEYMIYGDHNPNILSPSGNLKFFYNSKTPGYVTDTNKSSYIGEKGINMIGTDISSKAANNLYLRSVNKDVKETDITSANSTTLLVQSPKNANNADVDLKDRLMLQSGGTDTNGDGINETANMYRIYGEHNMKVVFVCPNSKDEKTIYFKDVGVDFTPNIVECEKLSEIDRKSVWIKDKNTIYSQSSSSVLNSCSSSFLTLVSTGAHLLKFYA